MQCLPIPPNTARAFLFICHLVQPAMVGINGGFLYVCDEIGDASCELQELNNEYE